MASSCRHSIKVVAILLATAVVGAQAEHHTIHFDNRCGFGIPTLVQNGSILSTGADYTVNGPIIGAVAYLQTGNCLLNGENCIIVEITLKNPTTPGGGSSTGLSLVPPFAFSVTSGFGYYNGCDGAGARCDSANCNPGFPVPPGTQFQVTCQANDVNLAVVFCS